ncbi:glycine C-acetyltransferase [bacterium]|nr:glycine C-acetyltransferase [candidate division CSSED10-310 bacterium]
MAYGKVKAYYQDELQSIQQEGLYKQERFIHSPQGADISVEFPPKAPLSEVINFCANNYLGLSSHPEVIEAAHDGLKKRGYGMSSVRFICGTQDIHKELEQKISTFLKMEDTILFPSCLDANGGLFEAVLGPEDAIIADKLVHASIIDGMRLCKAQQYPFKHLDMNHLEKKLIEASEDCRHKMIVTDGVFSMDGDLAPLDIICDLADKYDAIVVVDDSHATGFIGKTGRGVHELKGCMDRVDVITTTLGKALGGASGGCVSGRKEIVELCRQRARPYLFSNTMPPVIVSAAIKVLEIISKSTERRDKLEWNTNYFREKISAAGFVIKGETPIVPVMLFNAQLAQDFSRDLYYEGIYAVGFFFPVVPKGQARIRIQISANHEKEHLDKAINAFTKTGEKYGILGLSKNEIIEKYGS